MESQLDDANTQEIDENSIPTDICIQFFNQSLMDFNLKLQDEFKKKGHNELYLMDDTKWIRPNGDDNTFATDKVNMHLLNGQILDETDELYENNDTIKGTINSSQMNVLFPFKKVSSKSLYSEQLTVQSSYEIDDLMENSR
jgi:hypothetical protein